MFRRLVALGLIALTAACGSPGAARPGSGGVGHRRRGATGAAGQAEPRTVRPRRGCRRARGGAAPRRPADAEDRPVVTIASGAQAVLRLPPDPPWRRPGRRRPRTGQIRWTDHRSSVPLISASAALERMSSTANAGCHGCVPLRLTHPHLGLMKLGTTRGTASVPAWIFAVAGTQVRVAHPAVASDAMVTVTPVTDPADGIALLSSTLAADGHTLDRAVHRCPRARQQSSAAPLPRPRRGVAERGRGHRARAAGDR